MEVAFDGRVHPRVHGIILTRKRLDLSIPEMNIGPRPNGPTATGEAQFTSTRGAAGVVLTRAHLAHQTFQSRFRWFDILFLWM